MMGELALRYPRNTLVVSTGAYDGSAASDARFPQPIDRIRIRATRLRTVQGLALWTWRAGALAKRWRPGFTWCGELKPAGYPARWVAARHGVPYGVIVYGTELLLIQEKIRRSRFKRGTAGSMLGKARVLVAISRWTADLAREVLGMLDLDVPVETVPLGTTPSQFRPGVDASAVRAKYGLDGGPWLLTVARLQWHKGIDAVMKALPAIRARHPTARYAVAGTGELLPQFERGWDSATPCGCSGRSPMPSCPRSTTPRICMSAHRGAWSCWRKDLGSRWSRRRRVVGGRSGGVLDAVRDGETGILVDPDDPAAVAAGVNELLANPERRRQLGAAGRKAVETYYNWDRVANQLMEIDRRYAAK